MLIHIALMLPIALGLSAVAAAIPADRRADEIRTLDTPRGMPTFGSLAEWEKRRTFIREQILVSCGLYPLPKRTTLKPHVWGRIDRDGYSVEKVSIQTIPGFYLAGNLYRPRGTAPGARHPGVLIAHGHADQGRFVDDANFSQSARAITFARQGYVAFTFDMIGYNDTRQVTHRVWAADRRHWLWSVSEMGLQAWNSIRALDFLAARADVDAARLAITGESGGGTQTMILGAIDDRLAAVGPCVMVSHSMQGGCLCENAPGLRVDFSNMEIAACAAPHPQIMIGATGDWTKTMETVEGPAVGSVYDLYGRRDQLDYQIFPFDHNINQTSREAVYRFFGKSLLGESDAAKLSEKPYKVEPKAALQVFPPQEPLPKDALTPEALSALLMKRGQDAMDHIPVSITPTLLGRLKKTSGVLWQHTLALERLPASGLTGEAPAGGELFAIGRAGRGDAIPARLFRPTNAGSGASSGAGSGAAVLADSRGMSSLLDAQGAPGPLAAALLAHGVTVLMVDPFLTGTRADAAKLAARRVEFGKFFDTYNRTNLQERVQDLVTAADWLRKQKLGSVALCGAGQAGLWSLLAAPAADITAADCAQADTESDDALLSDDLYAPGLRRMGDFAGVGLLVAPHPLLLHNTGSKFAAISRLKRAYVVGGASNNLRTETGELTPRQLADWLATRLR